MPEMSGRAGRYVPQPQGYRAFVPAPLPPEPPIQVDFELTKLLSDADRALGRLDGVASVLPNADLYISDQDVFALQEKVIQQILSAEREVEARSAAPTVVDPIQQTVAEELKDALRRQTVDRELAKNAVRFLGQPMGRALHLKLKAIFENWSTGRDDSLLLASVALLAEEFSKVRPAGPASAALQREDLTLICFEFVSG